MAKTIRSLAVGFGAGCLVIAGIKLLAPFLVLAGIACWVAFYAHLFCEEK